jgi:hypothetical protein
MDERGKMARIQASVLTSPAESSLSQLSRYSSFILMIVPSPFICHSYIFLSPFSNFFVGNRFLIFNMSVMLFRVYNFSKMCGKIFFLIPRPAICVFGYK